MLSCTPIHYLRKPLNLNPCIGASKRIIVAKDRMVCTRIKLNDADICIDGLVSTLGEISAIEIIEKIEFNQQVDSTLLLELKSKYNLDGILLLTYIDDFFSERKLQGPSSYCLDCPKNYYLKYEMSVNTYWEYFDFTTGDTYRYNVENGTEGSIGLQNKAAIEDFYNNKLKAQQQVFFKNGIISSQKLTGLKTSAINKN